MPYTKGILNLAFKIFDIQRFHRKANNLFDLQLISDFDKKKNELKQQNLMIF